jgi:hypothetical protein
LARDPSYVFVADRSKRLQALTNLSSDPSSSLFWQLLSASWEPNTKRRYLSSWKAWCAFCQNNTLSPTAPPSLPTLRGFVVSLIQSGIKPGLNSSIWTYLSNLRALFHAVDSPFPDVSGSIKKLIVGAAKLTDSVPRQGYPVTRDDFTKILARGLVRSPDDLCIFVAARVIFALGSRHGNLVAASLDNSSLVKTVRLGNCSPVGPSQYRIDFPPTKSSKKRSIRLLLSAEAVFCLKLWMQHHPRSNDPSSVLFSLPSSGKPLLLSVFRQTFASWLTAVGIDFSSWASFNLRRGAATSLFDSGIDPETIRLLGFWSSNVYRRYIDTSHLRSSSFQSALSAL